MDQNYIVGEVWTNAEKGTSSVMGEQFYPTIEAALADPRFQKRSSSTQLFVAKVLPYRVVLVDENALGTQQLELPHLNDQP